jgi:release factor glutamine methyltransferase
MGEFERSGTLSASSADVALSPESSPVLPAPPLRGSRIGAADPRGVRREEVREGPLLQEPSLQGETKRQAVTAAARLLRQGGAETPELDARLLICHAAGLSHEDYVVGGNEALPPEAAARFAAAIDRRLRGEPVSRILGVREFYGRRFGIDASALDPRPDTETLVAAALQVVDGDRRRQAPLNLLDLGAGSGCILITLLAELPAATGVGVDLDPAALALARKNARGLGVERRARFVASDWLDGIDGAFDIIVCNPPYIATAEIEGLAREVSHDPRAALDGGADGLAAYRRITCGLKDALRPGGAVLLEVGAGQAEAVRRLLADARLETPGNWLWTDLGGRPRVVGARA